MPDAPPDPDAPSALPGGTETGSPAIPAAVPKTFLDYLRSLGPGIVVVLTWLGAGDLVDASVAGGTYGYALMWVLAGALVIRWIFVTAIARYQLCNPRGEGVIEGLQRLHPAFPPFLMLATIFLSHIIGVYMWQGWGEACRALFGGPPLAWSALTAVLFALLVFRPIYRRVEGVFLCFLAVLSVTMIGTALMVGPDPAGIVSGTIGFRLPETRGDFHPVLVATSLVGAVAGSLANLMYPYFIREKGWRGPQHRKVQKYDLAFGILVIIVLDLAVWVLGAEVLHPRGLTVGNIHDMASILGHTLGDHGRTLFYIGVLAAVGSSVVGNGLAYSYMTTDAYLLWRRPDGPHDATGYRTYTLYRWMVLWCLFSPLVWMAGGRTDFVGLTVAVNSFQVVLLPILAIGIWAITSRRDLIGERWANRWPQHLGMAVFTAGALLGAYGAMGELLKKLGAG